MSVVRFPFFSSSESGVPVKRLLLVVPVVAVFALSACESASTVPASSGDRVLESTTVAPVAPAVEPSKVEPYVPVDRTDAVLQSVAASEGIDMPDGMASEYADIICEGLDDGLSPLALVRIAAAELTQWDDDQHAFLVGASIGAKCPEFSYLVGGA